MPYNSIDEKQSYCLSNFNLKVGLAGERETASVLRNHIFAMEHSVSHDLSLKSSQLFKWIMFFKRLFILRQKI
ncbi:hypothetical protein J2Z23_004344 [Lederbergia galactosidilyticus]|nr:hypothetical protein [Lederbergia galactosidilytica]